MGAQTRTATTTNGLEIQKVSETFTFIGELSESGQAQVNDFSSDGVATSDEIASCVLLAGDQLFRVQQLSVGTGSDLVNDGWLKIQEHKSKEVLAGTRLREEGVESIIADSLIRSHLPVRLDTVL
jgi:hypothetical protein